MKNDKIYAVISGEQWEGYAVRGVYSTAEAALNGAKLLVEKENADGCAYKQAPELTQWDDGSHYIELVEWPLDKLFA